MIDFENIEKKIYKGLIDTCTDGINFNGEFYATIKPEYLITINISKAIGELNTYPGYPYLIKLEEKTKKFATRCIPDMIWENIFAPIIIRSSHNTDRNGRFDIVIYQETEENPITAIEVKLVNPTLKYIKNDILRLSELLHLTDNKTGNSKIKYSYFACIVLNNKIKFQSQQKDHLDEVKMQYSKYLDEILKQNENTKYEVTTLSLDESLMLTPEKLTGDEIFDGDTYSQAKHFVGVIMRLSKR